MQYGSFTYSLTIFSSLDNQSLADFLFLILLLKSANVMSCNSLDLFFLPVKNPSVLAKGSPPIPLIPGWPLVAEKYNHLQFLDNL